MVDEDVNLPKERNFIIVKKWRKSVLWLHRSWQGYIIIAMVV
jgi:hypothetical protein